jgi:hypothetical protein
MPVEASFDFPPEALKNILVVFPDTGESFSDTVNGS